MTIEDTAELQLQQEHVGRMESRPANIEGSGAVTQRDLLKNALRMRPDRIIVGETRGEEVIDMLQAMNTGHEGSMTTLHANSPRDALARLENMVGMSGIELPLPALRTNISSAIHVIVQVSRLTDGTRRMVSVQEVVGMEGDVITMQEIFKFERSRRRWQWRHNPGQVRRNGHTVDCLRTASGLGGMNCRRACSGLKSRARKRERSEADRDVCSSRSSTV